MKFVLFLFLVVLSLIGSFIILNIKINVYKYGLLYVDGVEVVILMINSNRSIGFANKNMDSS